MRLLLLIVNIAVGAYLLTDAPDTLAAYGSHKVSKSNLHRTHSSPVRDKKLRPAKKKRVDPGDLWERIRTGMQIPRPSLEKVQAEQAPEIEIDNPSSATSGSLADFDPLSEAAILTGHADPLSVTAPPLAVPDTAPVPVDQYTILGRRLKISAAARSGESHLQQTNAENHADLAKAFSGETRTRTTIGRHAELSRHNVRIASEKLESATPAASSSASAKLDVADNTPPQTQAGQRCVDYTGQKSPQPQLDVQQDRPKVQCGATEAFKYERVSKFIDWYKQHPGYLHQVAERAEPYLYHIVEGLNNKKLPLELALLPIVESAYQPTAQSPKSAAGLWQFIPSTGNDFELGQNPYYDDRLDITASTHAAIRFLTRLKQHFNGDWLLALAAYNCGQGAVDQAISQNRAKDLPTDFWSLPLPEETRDYVPRLLALSSIFAKPADHGIRLAKISDEPYFIKVNINQSTDINHLAGKSLATVAQLANLSYEKFTLLNPGFVSPTLPTDGPYTFLVPVANAGQLHQSLSSLTRVVATMQKIENSFAAEISALTTVRPEKYATPFLSLDMEDNKTISRLASGSVVSIL